jgi:hypothetical protein
METAVLILTVVLSAASAGAVSYSLNFSRDRLHFRRMKAEELYGAVERLDREIYSYFRESYSLYSKVVEHAADEINPLATPLFATVQMLTRFYFPRLCPDLARASAAAQTAAHRLSTWRAGSDVESEDLLLVLDASVSELGHALHDFKRAIVEHQTRTNRLATALGFGGSPSANVERLVRAST